MQNSLQDKIRVVRIHDNDIRIEKRLSNVLNNYLRNNMWISRRLCDHILKQHKDIFEHIRKIQILY